MADNAPESIPLKQCTKCVQWQPATTEYFFPRKTSKDGLYPSCKACRKAYDVANKARRRQRLRGYRDANREKLTRYHQQYREENREKLTEHYRQYREINREKLAVENHKAYEANRGKYAERARKYREANPEKAKARSRKWYVANREKVLLSQRGRKSNPEEARVRKRKWRAANPEKARAELRRRRAHKRNAEGDHTGADIQRQYKAQKGKCYYCKAPAGKDYQVDHVVPLSRGGSNDPANLVIACRSCNASKSDRLPHEWPKGNRLL